MKSALRLLVLATVTGVMSFAAMIDHFNGIGTIQTVSDQVADGTAVVSSTYGNRTIFADKVAGADGTSLSAVVIMIADGFFTASADATVYGFSGANYDGFWDLTGVGETLAIDVMSKDLPGSTLAFWISDGTNTATSVQLGIPIIRPSLGDAPQTVSALISGFDGVGGVNLGAITSLGFATIHAPEADMALDDFREYVVPEPGTYALMAAGLIGIYALRRRKSS